jgi:hypothetical protein
LLNTIGFLVILGDLLLAAIFLALALLVYLPTVRQEEDYLRRMHGEAFEAYRKVVPGIIPRLAPAKLDISGVRASRFNWQQVIENTEHRTWVALVVLFALLWARGAL